MRSASVRAVSPVAGHLAWRAALGPNAFFLDALLTVGYEPRERPWWDFIVGVIAKLIMPGKENMGFILTTLLGIAGSLIATYVGQAIGWYEAGEGAGWIGSIVGAFVLLWIYQRFTSRRAAT